MSDDGEAPGARQYYIRVRLNQLGCHRGESIWISHRVTDLKRYVLSLSPAQFLESLSERCEANPQFRVILRLSPENADFSDAVSSLGYNRPEGGCGQKSDELAPLHRSPLSGKLSQLPDRS